MDTLLNTNGKGGAGPVRQAAAAVLAVLAVVGCVLLSALSCTETELDLGSLSPEGRAEEIFSGLPDEAEMLVGDTLSFTVKMRKGAGRVRAGSADCSVLAVWERDDTTFTAKALSEGTSRVTVTLGSSTHTLKVTVSDKHLEDLSLSPSSLVLDCGAYALLDLFTEPSDYPAGHLNLETGGDGCLACTAWRDGDTGRAYVRVGTRCPGEGSVTVWGRSRDGGKVAASVSVGVDAVPVSGVEAGVLADSVFVGYDTLVRNRGGKIAYDVVKKYGHVYRSLPSGILSMRRGDTAVVSLGWLPENASVKDFSLKVDYANSRTRVSADGRDGRNLDSLLTLIDGGLAYDAAFGSKGVPSDSLSAYCTMEQIGFCEWSIHPSKPCTVIVRSEVEYWTDRKRHTEKKAGTVAVSVE